MGCCPSSSAWYLLLRIADRHVGRPASTRLTPSRGHHPRPGGNATDGWSTQSYRPLGRTIVGQGRTAGIVLLVTDWSTPRLCQRLQRYPQTSGSLAHRVEQGTFNPKVPGSSPGRPTSSEQVSGTPPVGRDRQDFPMFSHQRAVSPTGLPRRHRLRHVPGPRQSARRRPV